MIIDFHTHIFSPKMVSNRGDYLSDPCFAGLYDSPKAKMITADELVASMDKVGIDVSVALNIGWKSHELCVESNDYIMEAVARYPDRLAGFGAVQPMDKGASGEAERCAEGGLKGIGEMRPDVQGFDLGDVSVMAPIVEVMEKHGLIFLTHSSEPVGHKYPGKGRVFPEMLYQFAIAFPQVKFVCAHWGGGLPFYALMPEVAKALENTYFDTAATPYLYHPRIFEDVVPVVGSDSVLFGTDYPLMPQQRIIAQIEASSLSREDRDAILGGNAQTLLGL
ncbi:MAG: amidohydrolase [Dehalococcoidia bacterium]|nr:amidohydrolase [Dehalococcoidia bacterium]